MDGLDVERKDSWVRLVLDRSEARNALNTALLGRLADVLRELAGDADCRAVLLTGAGGHFAAGADIGEIADKTGAEGATDPRKDSWDAIGSFPKPMIAAVNGYCLGGGFELALLCDGIVLGETAKVGLPETNLGIIPGAGGIARLTSLAGRARAARMVLLGEILDADDAYLWGIGAWLAEGDADPLAEDVVGKLARRAPLAMIAAKAALRVEDKGALAVERASFEALLDSDDKREGIAAFREKRKPDWSGR